MHIALMMATDARPRTRNGSNRTRTTVRARAPRGKRAWTEGRVAWEDRPAPKEVPVFPLSRVVVGVAAIAATIPLLGACGGGTDDDSLPPLTPEPSLSIPQAESSQPASTASRSGARASYPARYALMKFLRGVGAGDVRVCGYVAPAYARTAFADSGGCRQWIGTVAARLTPEERTLMRTVLVPGATPGPGPGQYTIRSGDLRWTPRTATAPAGVLADQYVLTKSGPRWLLAG
jgi:hypothetical protein